MTPPPPPPQSRDDQPGASEVCQHCNSIVGAIDKLKESLEARSDELESKIDGVHEQVEVTQRALVGDFENRGALRRLEDLEFSEGRRGRVMWIAISSAIIAIVKISFDFIKGGPTA